MKYIIEFEDEYSMNEGGMKYHQCKQVPYWSVSHGIIKNLTPYIEPDRKAIEDEVWEFVRICLMMDGSDFVKIFDSYSYINLLEYSYQEAKAKYEAWLKQKDEKETSELEEVVALANKLGVHRLYSLVKEIRGE